MSQLRSNAEKTPQEQHEDCMTKYNEFERSVPRLAGKIECQPLEPDTDVQLHKEHVISKRKAAEFASRVLPEKCPR